MQNTLTPQEIAEYESRLRKARRDVFSEDQTVADAASKEIDVCKAALTPFWQERADEVRHRAHQRFLFLTD